VRTWACARYLASDVLRSQRALLPVILYAGVIAVLFGGDPGPLPLPWTASALSLYPVAAWLALVVANTEEQPARHVTVVAAGGTARVVGATLAVALAGDALLVALATAVPIAITHYPVPAGAVVVGLCVHAAAAATGTAVGLLVARPLVARIGWSFCIGTIVVIVTAVQPWLPPVGAAIRDVTAGGPPPWAPAMLGVVLAGAAAVVVWAVESRR
jgi:hypothetical protein